MRNIARILCCALAATGFGTGVSAQSICFWTESPDVVPIRIYVDEQYLGDITSACAVAPELDRDGCLSIDTTPVRHSLTAVDKYGRVYNGWNGHITPKAGEVYIIQLAGNRFEQVERDDYAYVFSTWAPVVLMASPGPFYGRRYRYTPSSDPEIGAGMAVTAISAAAALGAAAARNWTCPDNRFPYFSIGFNSQFFFGLREWRNVVQLKGRFGNLGGVSLLADAGWRHMFPSPSYRGFTWSVGFGFDYGGFSFEAKYKHAFKDRDDTFLLGVFSYDWWITNTVGINFNAGFGIAGYGKGHLDDIFEFPVGIGVNFKL